MIPNRPTAEQQRAKIQRSSTMHGRGEILKSLTTSSLCLLPTDLTITHPTCPATLALDRETRRIHVFDGSGWKPLVDTIVSLPPPTMRDLTLEVPTTEDRSKYTVFSDKNFSLFSDGISESVLKFELTPYSRLRTLTIPKENCVLPGFDERSNTLLGSVTYATTEGVCTDNTLLGADAGCNVSTGSFNTAIGSMAMNESVVGNNNVAVGYKSMNSTRSGTDNVSVGYKSLRKVQGECNIAIGSFSQAKNVIGGGNVSIGQDSLYTLGSGARNIAIGFESGFDPETGDDNVLVGAQTNFKSGTCGSIVLGTGGTSTASGQFVLSGDMTGIVELQSGTGIVLFSGVTSATRILLTTQEPIGVVGTVYISNRIPGTGFTVSSTTSADNSVIAWFAIEP
jgi:hypothetical protein